MSQKISRRNFLKGCGIAVGGVAAATAGAEIVTPLVVKEKMEFDDNTSLCALEQPPKNPPLKENIDVDVAIIGGGYTGLSSAYHLARRFPEKTIALFEARGVGHGASGRNGGMILTQTSNEFMYINLDPKKHKQLYDVTSENIREVASLAKAQNIDCDFKLNGALEVIVKEDQVEGFKKYCEQAQSLGMPMEFWDRERTRQEIGSDVYFGSLYEPHSGDVSPMKLVHALKKAAEGSGAHIYEDSPVLEVDEGEVIRLTVGEARHQVNARSLVLATNGYTSKLGYFNNKVFPVHTQVAATPPLEDSVFADIGWKNKMGFFDSNVVLYHLGISEDNRILIGAGRIDYFFNNGIVYRGDLRTVYDFLLKELVRIYPKLSGIKFDHIWSGVMGFTLDFSQSVGVMGRHKNIYYGLAYCGHGVNLATLFGKIISDLYAGEGKKWEWTPFLNYCLPWFPPEPLKWLGIQGYYSYLKIQDALR